MDWVVTTDMGLDDVISLLYFIRRSRDLGSNIHLKAVLADGNGLAHPLPAKANAIRLMRFAGLSSENIPPVGVGAAYPLDGCHQYPSEWRYKEDDIRGLPIPEYADNVRAQSKSSSAILRDTLLTAEKKLSILSLGSFTTLAQVLADSPGLASKIKRVVCMAGAINVDGNLAIHGLSNKKAEANAWIDPLATKLVFESGLPLVLVPLDATNRAPLRESFLSEFKAEANGPLAEFVASAWDSLSANPVGEYFHWDLLATAVALSGDLVERSREVRVKVDVGRRSGRHDGDSPYRSFGNFESCDILNWRGKPRDLLGSRVSGRTQRLPGSSAAGSLVDVVFSADIPAFEESLINVFGSEPDAAVGSPSFAPGLFATNGLGGGEFLF